VQPETTRVVLTLPARPESLVFCRLALVGLSRAIVIEPETLADLKLVVTEACSNAVRHAYGPDEGTVEVRFRIEPDAIEIEVEDGGRGFGEQADASEALEADEPAMGLAIMRALTDGLELLAGPDGRGSLVRLRKRVP
jgi:anti-sigma regulatory factor (Ser/Thr protein kinase)